MAASEFVVEWFVPIVLLTMIATALVVIVMRRGHLRLGRPSREREIESAIPSHLDEYEHAGYQAGEEVSVSTDWKQRLEQLGFEGFAKRVERNSTEVYGEILEYILMGAGGTFLMFGAIFMLVSYGTDFLRIVTPLPELLPGLGIVIFGAGAVEWLLDRRRQPLGLDKKQLALTVTWLDLKAKGIESPGLILDTPYPSEYLGFGLKVMMGGRVRPAVLRSIIKLGSEIPWSSEDARRIGSESSRYEAVGIVFGVVMGVFMVALSHFMSMTGNPYFLGDLLVWIGVIVLLVAILTFIIAVWQAVKWVRTKLSDPPWLRGTMVGPDVQPIDTLNALLSLLAAKCQSPLRVLVLGDYPELTYTGRVYRTNRGFQLKEALFIPSSGMVENP